MSGSAVRTIEKNRVGFHYANTPYGREKQIEKALASARVLDTRYQWPITFPEPQNYSKISGICDPSIEQAEIENVVTYCTSLMDELSTHSISTKGMCGCRTTHFTLQNSHGLDVEEKSTLFMIDMDVFKEGYTINVVNTSHMWDKDIESLVNAVQQQFHRCTRAKREITTSSCALGTRALYTVLRPFLWQLSIDRVKRGISKINLDHIIAGESFTLYDDGTSPHGTRTSICDGEGIPSKRLCIIEKGILKTFLYDHFHSILDRTESTGNAFRTSFMAPPKIMPRNMMVKEGNHSLSDFTGVVIEEFSNDKGANLVSGECVLNAKRAFYIKEGEVMNVASPCVIKGDAFTLLRSLYDVGIGKENSFPQYRELISPYVFIQMPS